MDNLNRLNEDERSDYVYRLIDELPSDDFDSNESVGSDEEYLPSNYITGHSNIEQCVESDHCSGSESSSETESEGTEVVNEQNIHENETVMLSKSGMEWCKISTFTPFQTPVQNIIREKCGPTKHSKGIGISQMLSLFLSSEIIDIIIRETNREAKRVYDEWNSEHENNKKTWKLLTEIELKAFIGLLISAGVFRSRMENIEEMWNVETGRPIFRATMSISRFKAITRFIRFDNRATRLERQKENKLAAISDVWEMWNQNLSHYYKPGTDLTIDEQLMGFRGRCSFRQFMKSKPAKYGIKFWWICDASNSYPLKGQVYLGKQPGDCRNTNVGEKVVLDLINKWKNSGRNLVTDNFFTSIPLAKQLLKNKITIVGTLRQNKKEIPKEMLPNKNREVNTSIFGFSDKLTLVSYVPKKNKSVILLSSMHYTSDIIGDKNKPEIIMHYNKYKGGVDNLDHLVTNYSCKRKTKRWPLAIFYNMLDVSGIAAYILYRLNNPEWRKNDNSRRRYFLIDLGRQLVHQHIEIRLQQPQQIQKNVKHGLEALGYVFSTKRTKTPSEKRNRCHICPRSSDRKIKRRCNVCDMNVCPEHSENEIICNNCVE